jgi:hypothetical protein
MRETFSRATMIRHPKKSFVFEYFFNHVRRKSVCITSSYRYFVDLGPYTLREQIKSVGSVAMSPVLLCHQWMGFSESTNYR